MRHPGQDYFAGLNSEALAGEVLLIKDQGHFAIDSGRLYVVTAAVGGDREGFEGEVFSVTLARESVRAAKFRLRASQRNTVALPGIAESAQMALRLSPLTSRSQIVSAISTS